MIVSISTLSYELQSRRDERNRVVIKVDGETVAEFWDGEPEDATINRDFAGVLNIPSLMKMAYDAGKAGEDFSIVTTEVNSEEEF